MIMKKEKEDGYYPNMLSGITTQGFKDVIVNDAILLNSGHKKEHIYDIVDVLCCLEKAVSESRVKFSSNHRYTNPLFTNWFTPQQ